METAEAAMICSKVAQVNTSCCTHSLTPSLSLSLLVYCAKLVEKKCVCVARVVTPAYSQFTLSFSLCLFFSKSFKGKKLEIRHVSTWRVCIEACSKNLYRHSDICTNKKKMKMKIYIKYSIHPDQPSLSLSLSTLHYYCKRRKGTRKFCKIFIMPLCSDADVALIEKLKGKATWEFWESWNKKVSEMNR